MYLARLAGVTSYAEKLVSGESDFIFCSSLCMVRVAWLASSLRKPTGGSPSSLLPPTSMGRVWDVEIGQVVFLLRSSAVGILFLLWLFTLCSCLLPFNGLLLVTTATVQALMEEMCVEENKVRELFAKQRQSWEVEGGESW
jgi:hypothetical protein